MKPLLILSFFCFSLMSFAQNKVLKTEEVNYKSANTKISASVVYPNLKGKLPAVVIVHGSGSSSRDNPWTAAYSEALSIRGIIVLHPDKRGSGESGGDWKTASLFDLANDAIAGVNYLRNLPEVDTNKIAIMGFSQGGDVIPIAASESYKIKMIIDVSGSVIPLKEQITDEIIKMGKREGLDEEQLRKLKEINKLSFNYVNDRTKWDEYESELKSTLNSGLGKFESFNGFPQKKDIWVWDWLKLVGDINPIDYWKKLNIPILFIFGGNDTQIDIRKSTDLILDNLNPLEKNFSFLFFRLNGHALFREDTNNFIAEWLKNSGEH